MTKIERSSGNVFEDLGFKNPEEAKTKAQLARIISKRIRERNLTQVQAGEILEVDQPKVSNLMRGKLWEFSVDRLMRFIVALGRDVTILIEDQHNDDLKQGHLSVTVTKADSETVTVRTPTSHQYSRFITIGEHHIDIHATSLHIGNPVVNTEHFYDISIREFLKDSFFNTNELSNISNIETAETVVDIPYPPTGQKFLTLEPTKHG